jgi:hypothetical protein
MAKRLTTSEIISRFVNKWGDKYDYSKTIYIKSDIKLTIICPIHGEFQQFVSNHITYGCGKCGRSQNTRNLNLKKNSALTFVDKAKNIHGDKYIYDKTIYITTIKHVIVTCPIHGDWATTPNNHLGGKGCPDCGIEKTRNNKYKSFDDYYNIFIEQHGDTYDYSMVKWVNGSTPIEIRCKKHGLFTMKPYSHKIGSGCNKCTAQYSRMAIEWLTYISQTTGEYIQHAENTGEYILPGTRNKVDGYCEKTNTVYEFLGDFWHGNPSLYDYEAKNPRNDKTFGALYENTVAKKEKIINMGYNYVDIWEKDWKEFKRNQKLQ